MSLKPTLFPKELWWKPFISREKQTKINLRHGFVEERQLKMIMSKKNVSPNIPCTFLLFKASAFLQTFFPRNLLFRKVLRASVFLNSKCLTFLLISLLKNNALQTSNKRKHIPLLINQFVSLIELKI